jgi:hypothetical protein
LLTRPEKTFTELGTKAIERGLADPVLSSFYDCFMSAQSGEQHLRLKPFLPFLSLCSDKMPRHVPPPIFYVGSECSQRQLFGDDWASPTATAAALTTPDHDLEQASTAGYRSALLGKPYYGYARTPVTINNQVIDIAFERLIVAVRPSIQSNYRFCAYFGVIQDFQRRL